MSIRHYMEALLGLLYPQERFCLCCKRPMPEEPVYQQAPTAQVTPLQEAKPPDSQLATPTRFNPSRKMGPQFAEESGLCDQCRNQMRPIEPPYCLLCGRHLEALDLQSQPHIARRPLHDTPLRCTECERDTPFVLARSYAAYQGVLRDLLHRYKFSKEKDLVQLLGPLLCEAWDRHMAHFPIDVLVAVPAHPDRLKERGFNPAELLTRHLTTYTKIPSVPLLQRAVHLQGQATRYREERIQALQSAYIIDPQYRNQADSKRILLIDDIYTTGSTAEACAQPLLDAGGVQVYVLTVAR